MKTKSFLQIGVASLSLLLLGTSAVLAADQAVCNAPSSTGVVFSTLKDGSITFVKQDRCALQFFGNKQINTESFNDPNNCDAFGSKAEVDAAIAAGLTTGNANTQLTASGNSIAGPILPVFEESTADFKLAFDKKAVTLTVGGTWKTDIGEEKDYSTSPPKVTETFLSSYYLEGGDCYSCCFLTPLGRRI